MGSTRYFLYTFLESIFSWTPNSMAIFEMATIPVAHGWANHWIRNLRGWRFWINLANLMVTFDVMCGVVFNYSLQVIIVEKNSTKFLP